MPTINGVGSGLDIEGLINASLIQRQRSVQVLEAKRALLAAKQGSVLGLKSKVSAFETAASGIKGLASTLLAASSSDPAALKVTSSSSASLGSHEVVVRSLANAHRMSAQGFVDRNTTAVAAGNGTCELRVGSGATISVDVSATTTLQGLADAINAEKGDVVASIVNDGAGATPYRLVLTSKVAGAANSIAILNNDTTLNLSTTAYAQPTAAASNSGDYSGTVAISGTFGGNASRSYVVEILSDGAANAALYRVSRDGGLSWDDNGGAGYTASVAAANLGSGQTPAGLQIAFSDSGTLRAGDRFSFGAFHPTLRLPSDAQLNVDGVEVTSASNKIGDAIDGVSLELLSADPAKTLSVGVTRSTKDVEAKAAAFVAAYNDLIGGIRGQQSYDKTTGRAGALLGDQVANRVVREVTSAVSREVAGATGAYKSLSEIGFSVSDKGVLSFDKVKLGAALEADTKSVLEVLEGASSSSSGAVEVVLAPAAVPVGSYGVNVTQAAAQASVSAGAAMGGPLGANETLNFTFSSNAMDPIPDEKVFQVNLLAGRTLAQVVADLNDAFKAQAVDLVASDEAGVLKVSTEAYGDDYRVKVFSNRSGAGSTQIGTSTITGQGVDIAGTIGGAIGSGIGDKLTAQGGAVDGLVIRYSGQSLGLVSTISVVQGAGAIFANIAADLNKTGEGALSARDKALEGELELMDARIAERKRTLKLTEERVRAQFVSLDTNLGRLKSQGESMLAALLGAVSSSRG